MRLRVMLEPAEEGGYTVTVPALPGCVSEGEGEDDALQNIREAISLYLEPLGEAEELPPGALVREVEV